MEEQQQNAVYQQQEQQQYVVQEQAPMTPPQQVQFEAPAQEQPEPFNLTPERFVLVENLLNAIELDPNAEAFMLPVDWEDLELKDYPDVIKKPMDLGTLRANLKNGVYSAFDDVFADIAQIWENCKVYNYSTDMVKIAQRMERVSNREVVKFCTEHGIQKAHAPISPLMKRKRSNRVAGIAAPEVRKPVMTKKQGRAPAACSTDLKMNLVAKVRKLNNDDVGKLVKYVSQLPDATIKESEGEQTRIRIDHFDTQTCKMVMAFADDLLSQEQEGMPNKRAATEAEVQQIQQM